MDLEEYQLMHWAVGSSFSILSWASKSGWSERRDGGKKWYCKNGRSQIMVKVHRGRKRKNLKKESYY